MCSSVGIRRFCFGLRCPDRLLLVATHRVYLFRTALIPLIAIRFLFGLAEAGAYSAARRALYNWIANRPGNGKTVTGFLAEIFCQSSRPSETLD